MTPVLFYTLEQLLHGQKNSLRNDKLNEKRALEMVDGRSEERKAEDKT